MCVFVWERESEKHARVCVFAFMCACIYTCTWFLVNDDGTCFCILLVLFPLPSAQRLLQTIIWTICLQFCAVGEGGCDWVLLRRHKGRNFFFSKWRVSWDSLFVSHRHRAQCDIDAWNTPQVGPLPCNEESLRITCSYIVCAPCDCSAEIIFEICFFMIHLWESLVRRRSLKSAAYVIALFPEMALELSVNGWRSLSKSSGSQKSSKSDLRAFERWRLLHKS